MQSITIGKPTSYLRLTALRWPPEGTPDHVSREKRRFLQAELHLDEVTATRRLDLHNNYAGLATFVQQVAAQWRDWDDTRMVWGTHSDLQLAFDRVRGAKLEPEYLILSITLRHVGGRQRPWTVETSLLLEADELQSLAADLPTLTD